MVGGHHDHVGFGDFGSRSGRRGRGQIHNGADDNASGTSAILELAQAFGETGLRPRRSILFMTFSGEERGLLGSKHYVENPIFPLDQTVAMLNLDMVGRGETGQFSANGVGTSPGFRPMLETIEKAIEGSEDVDLDVRYGASGEAPSDNTSFYRKGIPVIFFFTGTHPDYHMPSDDWDKINVENLDLVVKMCYFTLVDLSILRDERPAFRGTPAGGGDRGPAQRGPFLGIQAGQDRGDGVEGVRIGSVVEGASAAKAGLAAGDVITVFGEHDITSWEDLIEAIRGAKVGDEIEVTFTRDGESRTVTVTLGERE